MLTVYGLTYTFTSNYGTCLQAYALQTVIEKSTVNREKVEYRLIPVSRSPGYPKIYGTDIKSLIKARISKYSRRSFTSFEQKYIKYAPIKEIDRFEDYNQEADSFVCGSDVIWNLKYNHGIKRYFLDFANKYAFSYAASFGQSDTDLEKYPFVKDLIAGLNAVSVREPQSARIAEQCTGKDRIEVSMDPVLLLNRADWDSIAEKTNTEGKYIFVYSVNTTALLKRFVTKLSVQTGMKVVFSGGNAGAVLKQKAFRVFTPSKWLQLIRDAEYIVTDSFHGTAFSVLFRKKFYTIIDGEPGKGFNMRMNDFLSGISLESRIITEVPERIDTSSFDYTKADGLLQGKVQESLDYLQRNLEAAYRQKQQNH